MHNLILRNSFLCTNAISLYQSLCNDDNVVIMIDWTSYGNSLVRKGGNPVNGTLVSVCHVMQNVKTEMKACYSEIYFNLRNDSLFIYFK